MRKQKNDRMTLRNGSNESDNQKVIWVIWEHVGGSLTRVSEIKIMT